MNLLFICTINKVRSRTAEVVFDKMEEYSAKSAGILPEAAVPVSSELLGWADKIFVMEDIHEEYLRINFAQETKYREIIILDIYDLYYFMQPDLVELITQKVSAHLNSPEN